MAFIKYAVYDQQCEPDNPFIPDFVDTDYGQDFGCYDTDHTWIRLVPRADFQINAIMYDDDDDKFYTIINIALPNGEDTLFMWPWRGKSSNNLAKKFLNISGQFILEPELFDICMKSYRSTADGIEFGDLESFVESCFIPKEERHVC